MKRFSWFLFKATRPLLRQIENLQATYSAQINSLEKTERQLTDRLGKNRDSPKLVATVEFSLFLQLKCNFNTQRASNTNALLKNLF